MTAATPSLLDLGEGFLALPRRLCASSLFTAMTAEQRMVTVTLLLRARFAPGEFYFGGKRYDLKPGQLIDSEETIAKAAGTTRKVVRTTYRVLITAGLIMRGEGQRTGQCPHVTTIVDYERIKHTGGEAGPQTGRQGANSGPTAGQQGAPIEQGETREPLILASPSAPPRRAKRGNEGKTDGSRHQSVIALFCRLWTELRGGTYQPAKGKDGAAVKQLLAYPEATDDEIERRMRVAFADPFFLKAGGLAFFVASWSTRDGVAGLRSVTEPASSASEFQGGRRVL